VPSYSLGIDIGGTFTDVVVYDHDTGRQWNRKVLTTHDDRAGSANHTKNSANIARALATIKQNKSITIGKYYHREAPASGRADGR
jgi:N-methylhydantoinase A/oxoprolinase/acetone carboxylase beta subunit